MDHRRDPYSRPQDRPMIHNPNHHNQQTASQPPPPGPLYHPSTSSQPSFQIPASDPFQRRQHDPFLPQPQSQPRGSYALSSGGRESAGPLSHADRPGLGPLWTSSTGNGPSPPNSHHQSGPPAPPALSQATATSYAQEHARRRSIGGHSPPRYYASASSAEPPPPPVAFMSRQMPPPSPSQQPPPGPAYQGPRGPPPPPTFAGSRELPGLGSRGPGSGMSISSILGDGPAAQGPGQSMHGSPAGTSQSPPSGSQQPVSPHRRGHSMTAKLGDFGSWRRPHTPERHHLPAGIRAEGASYSANSSPAHFANVRRSPEFPRAGPPLFPPLYQAGGPPRGYQGSPPAGIDRDAGRHVDDRIPPRPSSQPAGLAGPPQGESLPREHIPPFGARPAFAQFMPPERREEHRPPATSAYEPSPALRDRPMTVDPPTQPYSPRKDPRDALSRDGQKEEVRREFGGLRDDHAAPIGRGFRHQYFPPRVAVPPPEAPRSHPQIGNPFDRPREGQVSLAPQDRAIPSIDPLARDDRRTSDPHAPVGEGQFRGMFPEHQPLIMQRSRSSIGLEGKRGRSSPMPQAVQGAQMQPTGAGSDPNIKSEFGRIFQGLGMGGSMTPSRGSPMPQRHPSNADMDPIVLSDGEVAPRSGSVSKRHKRVKEEESRFDDDDGRGTPLARGGKRLKPGHHHHLHQHNHGHHHHIHGHLHRPEELAGSSNASAHHHHHIHTSHHHHHSPLAPPSRGQPSTPAAPPMPKPTLSITSTAVLDAVKDRPRRHLGSELYAPTIALPPAAMAAHTYDTFGYFLHYKPSRTFEEKDLNCTFTVRVPRYYLSKEGRENVVRNRNVVGTGVCTDDSDPLGMCVHAGWLKGAWPEDIDVEMLDGEDAAKEDADVEVKEEYTTVPPGPLTPPQGKDLQITLLILPALKAYKGTVSHGLRSRDWDNAANAHDGVSWMVQKIRWVDEVPSAGARGGKARRERIEGRAREAALALVGLAGLGGGVGGNAGGAVAVA